VCVCVCFENLPFQYTCSGFALELRQAEMAFAHADASPSVLQSSPRSGSNRIPGPAWTHGHTLAGAACVSLTDSLLLNLNSSSNVVDTFCSAVQCSAGSLARQPRSGRKARGSALPCPVRTSSKYGGRSRRRAGSKIKYYSPSQIFFLKKKLYPSENSTNCCKFGQIYTK
jgi:hypothetical protein